MAGRTDLSSLVSTDAAPLTPRSFPESSMNFMDLSHDAMPGRRRTPNMQTQQGHYAPAPGSQMTRPIHNNQSHNQQQQEQKIRAQHVKNEQQTRKPNAGDLAHPGINTQKMNLSPLETELEKTRDSIQKMSFSPEIEKRGDSYSSMASCSSLPSANWEEELNKYEDVMPLKYKIGYFDALILYAEEDRDDAVKFKQHLENEIELGVHGRVKAMLYDCEELTTLSGSQIGHLALCVERSTYVFMYLTPHFVKDTWMEFSSESCLMTAIYDQDKRWCVVPVYTEKRAKCSFKIPMGLNSLKGINYYNNDEFYRKGVARLIMDKVPQRNHMNEMHKIEQKQWIEKYKRKQFELREKQKRVEQYEETQTMQLMKWLKEETERLVQSGVIPELHHSHSEGQLNTPNHSLPHVGSMGSLKDVHAQNPYVAAYFQNLFQQNRQALTAYTQDQIRFLQNYYQPSRATHQLPSPNDEPRSWNAVHPEHIPNPSTPSRDNVPSTLSDSVLFPLKTESGTYNTQIPKELGDKLTHLSYKEQNKFVQEYIAQCEIEVRNSSQNGANIAQYQQIQIKEQYLQAYPDQGQTSLSPSSHTGYGIGIQSIHHQTGPLSNAPSLSMNLFGPVNQSTMEPGCGQQYVNQPYLDALLSHSLSSQPGSFQYETDELASRGGQQISAVQNPAGNLPISNLFQNLEQDCGSINSQHPSAQFRSGDNQGEPLHSNEGRQANENDDKTKKGDKRREKHIHYTINVYSANAVQVGNQNMVQGVGGGDVDVEESSDEESDPKVERDVKVFEETKINEKYDAEPEMAAKDLTEGSSNNTKLLKIDPSDESLEPKSRAETGDQQNQAPPSQGSYNIDAALSSVGSHPILGSSTEQPNAHKYDKEVENMINQAVQQSYHATKQKLEFNQEDSDSIETTNQLPEELQNYFAGTNLKESSINEKYGAKTKTIPSENLFEKENNMHSDSNTMEFNRQDSKSRAAVALVKPMRPKIPSEDGDDTDVKEIVPSDQTCVKTASYSRASDNSVKRVSNTTNKPLQLLTKGTVNHPLQSEVGQAPYTTTSTNRPLGSDERQVVYSREVFSPQRRTNPSDLFFPNRRGVNSQNSPVSSGVDPLVTSQGGSSEGFDPTTGRFTASVSSNKPDLEYDMCDDSDSFEGTEGSASVQNSRSRSNRRDKMKGDKGCVIS